MEVKYQEMLDLFKQNVLEVEPTAQVLLYGSRARGDANKDSDWDVLVLSNKDRLSFKEEEQFMDHICDLMVKKVKRYNFLLMAIKIGINVTL